MHYGAVCDALQEFRRREGMTFGELCAFLYDYAPKAVGGLGWVADSDGLPEPTAAFLIGGSATDLAQNGPGKNGITAWQCSPDAVVGDVVVFYTTSPDSCISSMFRCVSDGFDDPFFWYYRCCYIAVREDVSHVPLAQLRADTILGGTSIVRRNMQGVNGWRVLPSEYNHILELTAATTPRIEFYTAGTGLELARESQVEEKLIVPLLERLGYSPDDYRRQLHVAIGNHNATLIPDFVLLPTDDVLPQAFGVLEAKFAIGDNDALEQCWSQARSYARLLATQVAIVADRSRVIVREAGDDYRSEVFCATWTELNNPDTFDRLRSLVGKRKGM